MIQTLLKRLMQLLLLVVLQVLVCNHIHLFGLATPMLYVLFLVWTPLNANRIVSLLSAFALGLIVDIYSNTPGEAAASLTLAAFIQHPLLHTMAPKESIEDMVPSYKTMGTWNHIYYVTILTVVHHTGFYLLESFSFFHARELWLSLLSSTMLSLLLMLTVESLFSDKKHK